MSTEVREGLCYRRNPASQRTGKWKSHASGYSFFLLVSLKWASAAGCTLPTDPSDDARCMLQICPFRSGSPCDLVALREFWKSEKPSVRGTCSDMSLFHAYMVLRSRGKSSGKILATQDVVCFMNCKNDIHTILTVNTGTKMEYTLW